MGYFRVVVVGYFLFQSLVCFGQNLQKADSLLEVYRSGDLSQRQMFEVSNKISFYHPDYTIALEYAQMSLDIAIDLEEKPLEAKAYEEIGANYRLLGDYSKAVESTLKALEIYEELEDSVALAATYVQLGSNFTSDGNPEQAIPYFVMAVKLYEISEKQVSLALTFINLGEAYRLSDQPDSAIYNFKLALSLNDSLQNEILEGYSRGNLGMALRSKGELNAARAELNPAIEILTELGDPYSVSVYTAELAQINEAEGKQKLAEQQLLEAYKMAKGEGLKEQIRDFSEMLVAFYEKRGAFDKALSYQKVYQVYQDSLVNKANVQQVERLKANYEIDKREGEIGLLNKVNANQRNFNMALGGGILIFGVLAVMLYQSNRQKNDANGMLSKQQIIVTKREEEKALLLKELNHRVKNNLQMVSSLLSLQGNELIGHPAAEAINAGKSRVEALSLIHQKLYQDDVHTTINIEEYLEQLVSNLFYSFGEPFKPALDIAPYEMDIDTAIPVSLIVNELVTNALKYAYEGVAAPQMQVILQEPNGNYYLEISDNGVGLDHDKDISNSFGLKLVRSLVQQLDGTLEMKDNPEGGISWIITIPMN